MKPWPQRWQAHTTAESEVVVWDNWQAHWGVRHYLVLLGVGVQGAVAGALTAVGGRWVGEAWWWVGGLVWLGLAWGLMWQLRPLWRKGRLVLGQERLAVYEIGVWGTQVRQFGRGQVVGLELVQGEVRLVYRVRPFGREALEMHTRYPLAPWLHPADQEELYGYLAQKMDRWGWRVGVGGGG